MHTKSTKTMPSSRATARDTAEKHTSKTLILKKQTRSSGNFESHDKQNNETVSKPLKTDNPLTYIHWTSFNNCSSNWYSSEKRTEAERVWESPWGCSSFAYTTVLRLVCTHNCRRYYALTLKTPFKTQNTMRKPQGYETKQCAKNSD
jgi:hypothetical protein